MDSGLIFSPKLSSFVSIAASPKCCMLSCICCQWQSWKSCPKMFWHILDRLIWPCPWTLSPLLQKERQLLFSSMQRLKKHFWSATGVPQLNPPYCSMCHTLSICQRIRRLVMSDLASFVVSLWIRLCEGRFSGILCVCIYFAGTYFACCWAHMGSLQLFPTLNPANYYDGSETTWLH